VPDYRAQGFRLTRVEVLDAGSKKGLNTYEDKKLLDNMLFPDSCKEITIPMVLD
jgi:hypothetical protein